MGEAKGSPKRKGGIVRKASQIPREARRRHVVAAGKTTQNESLLPMLSLLLPSSSRADWFITSEPPFRRSSSLKCPRITVGLDCRLSHCLFHSRFSILAVRPSLLSSSKARDAVRCALVRSQNHDQPIAGESFFSLS